MESYRLRKRRGTTIGYYYLASPYTDPSSRKRDFRYEKALEVTAQLTKLGYVVYSPIVHSHPMAEKYDLPKESDYWLKVNRTFVSACHALIVLCIPGWSLSKGINEEVRQAGRENKEIFYIKEASDLPFARCDEIPKDAGI